MKKRNPVAKAHIANGPAGSGRHKDKRRMTRSAAKAALRKEVRQ